MRKLLSLAVSGLLSLSLAAFAALPGQRDEPPPPPKKGDPKKKEAGPVGPVGEVRKAYDLLRRIKADDGPEGRREERLRDWTERAVSLYRKALRSLDDDPRVAGEYGLAAHDLARAVEHARNASRYDHPDPDLPPPPAGPGREEDGEQARRELRHAYDRIQELDETPKGEAKFYVEASRDLYSAARRDAEADRNERAAELARASEAMTHVPEHLERATEDGPDRPEPPKAKKKDRPEPPKAKKKDRPEPPKAKKDRPEPDGKLPPPLD